MEFPKTWEEYEKDYGFNDSKEVYTNNSRLIQSFRVKQWLDHLLSVQPKTDVLDKIRVEIIDTGAYEQEVRGETEFLRGINYCLGVIDKCKVESEPQESEG